MGKSVKRKQQQLHDEQTAFQQRFAQLSRAAAHVEPPPPLINEFQAYSEHFVRPADTFVLRTRSAHRDKQALELARHLFGRFRVPRVLEQAWSSYLGAPTLVGAQPLQRRGRGREAGPGQAQNINLNNIDFRAWFVCVATGGSLYKTHTKDLLTKKETHTFLGAPAALTLCQAVIYAVAIGAGASVGNALRLARSKLAAEPFGAFWFDCVRFFCLPDHLPDSVDQTNDLVDYLAARKREDRQFRLLGSSQTLAAVKRRMVEWHRSLARAKDLEGISWEGVAVADFRVEQKDPNHHDKTIVWEIHQITTGKELAAEGTAMRHCVYGYKHSCVEGRCSIWSLTSADTFGHKVRKLTIEVNNYGHIVQMRGLANRTARPEERHIVNLWSRQAGLMAYN
jgi:hypothetical protein